MDIVNVETSLAEEGNCLVCTIDDLGILFRHIYSVQEHLTVTNVHIEYLVAKYNYANRF